jgi:hypothetical protein
LTLASMRAESSTIRIVFAMLIAFC